MQQAYEFLKSCGTFYLATDDDGQPRVRPFGAVCAFEGKLYLVTNNQKAVYHQVLKNNRVEVCGMAGGKWIRICGTVKEDLRRDARVAMLEQNPSLCSMYSADDGLMTVLYFTNGKATISSFTDAPLEFEL